MADERVRQAHEATIAMLDEELRKLQQQIEARRDIDGARVNWGHVGTLGHVHELLLRATAVFGKGD